MTALEELKKSLQASVTKGDLQRLNAHLGNWNHLNEILMLKDISTEDIKKFILIEVTGRKRVMILDKLAARLKSRELTELRRHLMTVIR